MSIHNFLNKIKGYLNIDNSDLLFFLIILGVAISSFGLGKISAINSTEIKSNNQSNVEVKEATIAKEEKINSIEQNNFSTENYLIKKYVASKNGKLYYSPNCSGAKRIKEENKIWFSSQQEAEKFGFLKSSSCQY